MSSSPSSFAVSAQFYLSFWRKRLAYPGFKPATLFLMVLPLASLMLAIGLFNGLGSENVRIWHQEMRLLYPSLTRLIQVVSTGSAWVLYGVYAAIFIHAVMKKDRQELTFIVRFVFCLALVLLLAGMLKVALGMPRPGIALPPAPFSFQDGFAAFPSGHTVQIITAALPLAFYLRRKWLFIGMSMLITLIGYSRLWLGKHDPFDILAGILVGSLIVVLIFRPVSNRKPDENR